MCGILAFASDNVENFNRDKFNVLGIINETRGKHSCGITVDGVITKGVGELKVWRDFAAFRGVEIPKKHPIVIGHTRHATLGVHNADNAHPFGFKDDPNDENYAFIGVHNGSLYNHKDLAEEYDVDKTALTRKLIGTGNKAKTKVSYREKIDSEILLEIIFKTGEYSVLEKYNGAAALVWYKPEEPNVIYCYHGESKEKSTDKEPVEERPLFYGNVDGGTYISSIPTSLLAIGVDVNDIESFEYNKVYKITNGDVKNAEITEVDRSNALKKKASRQSTYTGKRDQNYYNTVSDYRKNKNQLALPINRPSSKSSSDDDVLNIYHEETAQELNEYKAKLYFNKLRYWRNGHLITGIYAFIRGFGHFYMGQTVSSAQKSYRDYVNKVFLHDEGEFSLTREAQKGDYVPFVEKDATKIDFYPFEYIYRGMLLKTELDYEQLRGTPNNLVLNTEQLSHATKHPIININTFRGSGAQNILYNGKTYTGRFTVLGAEKLYNIKDGNLIGCTKVNNNFNIMSGKDIQDNKKLQKDLITLVVDDIKSEQVDDTEASDKMLLTDINKMLLTFYTALPEYITHARSFKQTEIRDLILDNLATVEGELNEIASIQMSKIKENN